MSKKITLLLIISLFSLGCQSQETVFTPDDPPSLENNSNQSAEVLEDLSQATDSLADTRDQKRLADISDLKNALELYYTDQGFYPNSLEELEITQPVNPTPGGTDYSYTPIGRLPAQYYDLCYTLESDGYHCVNPQ